MLGHCKNRGPSQRVKSPVEIAKLRAAGDERVDAVDPDLRSKGGPRLAASCRLLPNKAPAVQQASPADCFFPLR
jgi:hypothetical protein